MNARRNPFIQKPAESLEESHLVGCDGKDAGKEVEEDQQHKDPPGEREEVRKCYDVYEMLRIYRKTPDKRVRFELLRKLGLIVLIARIKASFSSMTKARHIQPIKHM